MRTLKLNYQPKPVIRSVPLFEAAAYREWMARHLQQSDSIGDGIPYPWKRLDEESKEKWRKHADSHAKNFSAEARAKELEKI